MTGLGPEHSNAFATISEKRSRFKIERSTVLNLEFYAWFKLLYDTVLGKAFLHRGPNVFRRS